MFEMNARHKGTSVTRRFSGAVSSVACVQTCETRVTANMSNRFIVAVTFTNLTSDVHLKDLDVNVLDSLNTKLMRGVRHTHTDTQTHAHTGSACQPVW